MLRFIAGLGSGVEAPVGAALIAETWRNRFRARAGGIMMSGYAFGFFAAAAAYALLGDHGWRFMLALAGLPALLVWFIRRYVPEPPEISAHLEARRERKRLGTMVAHDRFALRRLIEAPLRRPMLVCTALATGALIAFWSVTTWYPQIIRQITAAEQLPSGIADHRVAMAAMLFNAGGIVGYASWGFVADAIGRRKAFLLSFAVSAVTVAWTFPFDRSYTEYLIALPFLGFGLFGALSGTFIYAPELFPPSVRATALAVCNSVGRYVTALGPLTAGAIATSWFDGNLGLATASVTALGLIAVVGLAFARETRGEPMPADPHDPTHREERSHDRLHRSIRHRRRRLDRRPHRGPAAAGPGVHGGRLRAHRDRTGRPGQRHRPAARHRPLVHRAQHPGPGRPEHVDLLRAVPRPHRRPGVPGEVHVDLHLVGHVLPGPAGRLRVPSTTTTANTPAASINPTITRRCASSAAGRSPPTWWCSPTV